jgi:hypothetical protein
MNQWLIKKLKLINFRYPRYRFLSYYLDLICDILDDQFKNKSPKYLVNLGLCIVDYYIRFAVNVIRLSFCFTLRWGFKKELENKRYPINKYYRSIRTIPKFTKKQKIRIKRIMKSVLTHISKLKSKQKRDQRLVLLPDLKLKALTLKEILESVDNYLEEKLSEKEYLLVGDYILDEIKYRKNITL